MTSPTFIRTPQGAFFAQGQNGLVAVTDPVQLHELLTGATPSEMEDPFGGGPANVTSPTTPQYAQNNTPAIPQAPPPGSQNTPPDNSGQGSGGIQVTSTGDPTYDQILGVPPGSPPPPPGTSPVTAFNANLASILKQMQASAQAGRAALGGAADTLNTESITTLPKFDPTIGPEGNNAMVKASLGGFAPAVTSINTQLTNADAAEKDLEQNIGTIASTELPTAVSPGQSLVTPGGTTVSQGHSYTPEVNPETGLIDGFDQNTGTWASQDRASGGNGGGASSSANPTIEAIFGASNPIGAYASDPNYVNEISGLYQTVNSLGVTGSAESLGEYIKNNAGNAPVTGQMILNAASTYGIDPALLTTVLLHESDFGTAGAAAKTMNPGNQGNTGTSTQSYNSWSQGVMATAKNLADRIKQAGVTPNPAPNAAAAGPGTKQSTIGGTFSNVDAQKVSQLPQNMQHYVQAGPAGVAYFDETKIPTALQQSAQTLAAQVGIPYLAAGDVSSMQSLIQAQQNLNLMESTAKGVLGSGVSGFALDQGATLVNSLTGGNAFPSYNQFQSYATEAINLIKGLAGGTGSGLRMTQSEIDTAQQNIPTSGDTLANAMKKIQVLQGLIYTRISAVFPNAQVVMVNPQTHQQGYVPAAQYSDAVAQGYTTP